MILTPWRVFFLSIGAGALFVIGVTWVEKPSTRREAFNAVEGGVPVRGVPLLDGVTVRDQITLAEVARIAQSGIRTIVILRPDGEERDQASSAAVAAAARAAGLSFAYLPTPVNEIPDAVVDALAATLAREQHPVLLYCGSGWRAARVWALAEASRPGGADAATIMAAVRSARHDIDDLRPRLDARISARSGAR